MTIVNPFLEWPVSQGWLEGSHRNNPAIDYAIPYGTTLLSPCEGRLSLSQGSDAGLRVAIIRADDSQIILCHNSQFIGHHGDYVQPLQPLALSGNTGLVIPAPTPWDPYSGSHLHTYGLHPWGGRWNWTLDAANDGTVAGGGAKPLPKPKPKPEIQGDEMRGFAIENTSRGTVFYKYSIDDAKTMSQAEASALAVLLGGKRLPRLTGAQATVLLRGIKEMRARRNTEIAKAVGREVKDDFDDLEELIADLGKIAPTSFGADQVDA